MQCLRFQALLMILVGRLLGVLGKDIDTIDNNLSGECLLYVCFMGVLFSHDRFSSNAYVIFMFARIGSY